MNTKKTVPVFVGTTEAVEQHQAFDYWRSTVMSGSDLERLDWDGPFSASRTIAQSAHGAVFHTISRPFKLDRTSRHIRMDGRDEVGIMMVVKGRGYIEQGNNGALLRAGDLTFQTWGRPGSGGGLSAFEELRLAVPRATFQSQIGNVADFAGSKIAAGPLNDLFGAYLRAFAGSVASMSDTESGIAIEGALHLLRGIIQGQNTRADNELSLNAVRSLALAHIEHCLHDPAFSPASLAADLRVSRTRLYAAFAGGEGVAAAIRAARLDRARDRILRMRASGHKIAQITANCGFTDAAAFSRAFRRRFGLSPRDLLAQGG